MSPFGFNLVVLFSHQISILLHYVWLMITEVYINNMHMVHMCKLIKYIQLQGTWYLIKWLPPPGLPLDRTLLRYAWDITLDRQGVLHVVHTGRYVYRYVVALYVFTIWNSNVLISMVSRSGFVVERYVMLRIIIYILFCFASNMKIVSIFAKKLCPSVFNTFVIWTKSLTNLKIQ